jgi:flagellar operon protein
MDDKFQVFPQPLRPLSSPAPARPQGGGRGGDGPSFDSLLAEKLGSGQGVQFSRHALQRMESRGIRFGPAELARVNQAVGQLGAKGGKDSLVLLDETALVVSVKNKTVVTVVDRSSLAGNVFTNIDSAIIA